MKKRSFSLLLVLVMVLSLLPVSALAQVYEVTSATETVEIRFQKDDGTAIGTQTVNNNGGSVAEGAIYDPGCPLGDHEVFKTWSFDGNTGDVEAIRSYVNDNWIALKGAGLDVTAVTSDVQYLVYFDENDRVLKTQGVIYTDNGRSWDTTVDMDYVPAEANKDFFGWATTKGATTADYQNGDTITLNAPTTHTSLYPVVKAGYWLSFDNNLEQDADDTSASFAAPQFYAEGDSTAAPTAPTRPGYRLEGWYEDAALTTKYNFNAPLSADKIVYAKWVPDGTVEYQVIFWKQKTTDDPYAADVDKTYDYCAALSTTRTAQAGSTVSIQSADTQMARSATPNITTGTNEKWNFFNYNAANTDTGSVLVKGDGSTVLNVYYDRQPITINFWTNSSTNTLYYDTIEDGRPSYTYNDPWDTGYYMIGKPGPLGADWKPTAGTTVYSYDDLRKENVTDSSYKGDYYEYSSKNPNANNIYSASNSDFQWYNGTLYHRHNYWLSTRWFAQFYYYENQSGTYYEGEGPEADISHGGTEVSGTHYRYVDPFASNYYIVGGNGPVKYSESNPPSASTPLWYYHNGDYESSSLTSGMGSTFPQSTNRNPNNSSGIYYPSSPQGTYHWFEGYLYDYHRDWTNSYYHALYYWHDNQTGYYPVGTGPDPTAPGTAVVKQSTYTGLYGAEFNDWIIYNSNNQPIDWSLKGSSNTYPMPVLMFDNFDEGSASAGQATVMNLYPNGTTSGSTVHYQGQTVDGGGYEDFITFKSSGTWYPTEQFVGFTIKDYGRSVNGPWTGVTSSGSFSTNQETWVRFTRHQNKFVMTSNNADVVNDKLYYEAPLNKYGTSDYVPTNGPAGTFFDGWYADPAFTTPFDFNTEMPDNDVRVYAKWTTMRFRVVLDPTGGDDSVDKSSISFGENNQVTSFRVDYGEKIEKNAIAAANREGYQLVGWYTDPAFRHPFSFDTADWTTIADFEYAGAPDAQRQGTDYWNENKTWSDVDADDVVGKVVIYAKWRQNMDANEYITIVYDAGNGTINGGQTYTSPLHYADHAQAIAQPGSKSNVPRENFLYWEILGPEGEPTGKQVRSSNIFDVMLSDTTEGTDGNGHVTHTLTLRAVYQSNPTTHVTWVGNGGTADGAAYVRSDEAALNANIPIKPVDTFTYPNHVFLGWAKLEEDDVKISDTEWEPQPYLDENHVWLKWENGKWYNQDGVEALAISADEILPYNVLYAVWQEIPTVNYFVDFNAKMKLAENATIAADPAPVENNGDFTGGNGSTAFYQLKQITAAQKLTAEHANLAFSGIDAAQITGRFYDNATRAEADKQAASYSETRNVNMIPASSVYFADNLTETTAAIGDGSGYSAGLSSPATTQVNTLTERTITFTGTGIDINCTTDNASGWISANLYAGDAIVANGAHQNDSGDMVSPTDQLTALQSVLVKNNSVTPRYGCPTIRFTVDEPGTYTVRINTSEGSNYRFEGVRIYHPADASDSEAVACYDANDQVPFTRVRDILIAANTFNASGDADVSGAVFVENYTEPAEGETHGTTTPESVKVVSTYKDYGPKGEVYLEPDQAIVFKVDRKTPLLIGMSSADGTAVTYAVTNGTGVKSDTISSTVDMYYEAQPDANGYICIKNDGERGLLAITNVRAKDAKTEGGAISFSVGQDVLDVAARFDQLRKSPWNSSAVSAQTLLKAVWQQLLQSLKLLFAGLDKW